MIGIVEQTETPRIYKIHYEFGLDRRRHLMIKTNCPFGVPRLTYKEYDVFSVGSLCCQDCDCFTDINREEQYVLYNRNVENTVLHRYRKYKEAFNLNY